MYPLSITVSPGAPRTPVKIAVSLGAKIFASLIINLPLSRTMIAFLEASIAPIFSSSSFGSKTIRFCVTFGAIHLESVNVKVALLTVKFALSSKLILWPFKSILTSLLTNIGLSTWKFWFTVITASLFSSSESVIAASNSLAELTKIILEVSSEGGLSPPSPGLGSVPGSTYGFVVLPPPLPPSLPLSASSITFWRVALEARAEFW